MRAARDSDGLLRSGAFFADLAVEHRLSESTSGVTQISIESPRLRGFHDPELDGWPINLVLGMAGKLGERWGWDVSFQEDIPATTPATDFTLSVGVRRSW